MTTSRAHPIRPFGHVRLTAFFVLVAIVSALFGLWRVQVHMGAWTASDVGWTVVPSVALCAGLGFLGVFVHRRRINPVRWRETENYLLAIRRESAKYRALMEGAADLLLVVEPRSRVVREASAHARAEFGLAEGSTSSVLACLLEADHERFLTALERAAAVTALRVPVEGLAITTARGATRTADARLAAVDVEGERLVQVALRDVTQQKEMERSLVVHERLSSIGLLTAGVAHEINNPLEGIGNYLKLLEREADPDVRARYLGLVRHGFARIGEIVRDLLRFARPQASSREADVRAVVDNASKLAAYAVELKSVRIETIGLEEPLLVQGDAGRLEQVVVNLLLNAGAAMHGQGRIAISARRTPESELELTVEDDGPGIPPADLARIFDPFYTTTAGSGLGLFVSYGIVAAHGGRIWAENRSAGGARFTLRLPLGARTEGDHS